MPVISSIRDPQLPVLLKSERVGIIPTDTIYGLAALAGDQRAVERLYSLKSRERKPGTLIAASLEQLIEFGLDAATVRQVAHLWPAPLSIIIVTSPSLRYLDQGLGDLAVRIPAKPELLDLLMQTGPLLTSSANLPGEPPANNLDEAQRYFGDKVDFYVDGGDLSDHPPSTIARLVDGRLEVLRQGAAIIGDKL